jgi:hypothetical protein
MTIQVNVSRLGVGLMLGLFGILGCEGGSSSDDGASRAGNGGSSNQTSSFLPSRLPKNAAECASATGNDGCFFKQCCDELVSCADNAACAAAFTCYAKCPASNADCLTTCATSAAEEGLDDFATALGCAAPATGTCGNSAGPGNGGAGGDGGMSTVGPLGAAKDELGWTLLPADEPLKAELTVDDARAVSREVTLEGGQMTATAKDGTVYELTIPEGALYGPTVITLTPLRSLSALPLEGETHGVRIEPDGLPLMGSPSLRITPPKGVEWPAEQELPLAITGEDNHVSLALLDPESEPLRVVLTHFSSYVVLFAEKGIDATLSQADIRKNFAGDAERRLESAAAERLSAARQRALRGDEASIQDLGLESLFAEFDELVLKPRLAKAGDSCASGKLALSTLLGKERQRQLLGFPERDASKFAEVLATVAKVCMREEYEICRDEHIITRVLPTLYGYMHNAAVLGLGTEIDGFQLPPTWLTQAEDYARKCLQFELQFDSNVTYAPAEDSVDEMSERVTARVPIGLTASLTVLPQESVPNGASAIGALILGPGQPLESKGYRVTTQKPCYTIDATHSENGELLVSYMGFTPGMNSPKTPGGSAQLVDIGLSIALRPNLSGFDFSQLEKTDSGCGGVSSTGSEVLSWSSTLGSYLLSVSANANDGAWLDDWKLVNTDIIATKDLTLNDGQDSQGSVHLILFHTPQK